MVSVWVQERVITGAVRYVKVALSQKVLVIFFLQYKYSKSLSWAENLNKLFTVLGGKFKFFAQDSELEYLYWRNKKPPSSSDLKPPLVCISEKKK